MPKHQVTLRNRGNLTLSVGEDEAILDVFESAGYVLPVGCRYDWPCTPTAAAQNSKPCTAAGASGNRHFAPRLPPYSHSIVAGGLLEMS